MKKKLLKTEDNLTTAKFTPLEIGNTPSVISNGVNQWRSVVKFSFLEVLTFKGGTGINAAT